MTQPNDLNTPWSLHFDRDGTEDIAIICDADGHDLVTSRHFWLPEGDNPVPPTLAGVRLMVAAPKLLHALTYFFNIMHDYQSSREKGYVQQAMQQAKAAIVEATGRPA